MICFVVMALSAFSEARFGVFFTGRDATDAITRPHPDKNYILPNFRFSVLCDPDRHPPGQP
jgi:hypothetical protein